MNLPSTTIIQLLFYNDLNKKNYEIEFQIHFQNCLFTLKFGRVFMVLWLQWKINKIKISLYFFLSIAMCVHNIYVVLNFVL